MAFTRCYGWPGAGVAHPLANDYQGHSLVAPAVGWAGGSCGALADRHPQLPIQELLPRFHDIVTESNAWTEQRHYSTADASPLACDLHGYSHGDGNAESQRPPAKPESFPLY